MVGVPKRLSRTSRRLSLTGLLLIGMTIAGATFAIWDRHAETLAHIKSETAKLSVVIGEQTARSIQAIDLVLQEMQARLPLGGDPDALHKAMGSGAYHAFLGSASRTCRRQGPSVSSMRTVGWSTVRGFGRYPGSTYPTATITSIFTNMTTLGCSSARRVAI